jgi:hypothetical protein
LKIYHLATLAIGRKSGKFSACKLSE